MPIPDFIAKYKSMEPNNFCHMFRDHCLAGRLMSKVYSSDVITYELVGFGGQIQVKAFPRFAFVSEDYFLEVHSDLRVGDYVCFRGFPAIIARKLCMVPHLVRRLSYCLYKMPPMLPVMEEFDASTPESGGSPGAYILKDQVFNTSVMQYVTPQLVNSLSILSRINSSILGNVPSLACQMGLSLL
nr:uncharacterized protein LOC122587514 [Erigeron canadensis]